VQAALLEAMAEKQITADNGTHRLDDLFFVLATQNPLDLAGTYPLPRAQLDRFLFKIKMTNLSRAHQLDVLARCQQSRAAIATRTVSPADVVAARKLVTEQVSVHPLIHECLVDLSEALEQESRVLLGISTRSLVQALPALQVWAMLHGRDYVIPRDVAALAVPLFSHRLEMAAGAPEAERVVTECMTPIVEAMTRKTLKR
jgi:MoxR-like ATPase